MTNLEFYKDELKEKRIFEAEILENCEVEDVNS